MRKGIGSGKWGVGSGEHRSTGAPEYRRKKLIANKLKKM